MARQKYIITFQVYQNSQYLKSNCGDITFINTGGTSGFINGFELTPNSQLGFTCQYDELDTTSYNITFPSDTITNNSITVIKKTFVI
jgi:hypothetical protein